MTLSDWTRTPTMRGLLPLGAFAFCSAAVDVYAGNVLQRIDPMVLAALSFTMVGAISVTVHELRGAGGTWARIRSHRGDVLALNLTTAVTWLSLLYALKYAEPAVANVVSIAIGPACAVLFIPVLRRGSRPLPAEVITSGAILVLIAVLVWASFAGHTAVGLSRPGLIALGLAGAVVSGIASALNIIYSKRLSAAGLSPVSVMAVRFFVVVAVSWPLALRHGPGELGDALVPALTVGVVGVALPLYLLQAGIRHVEPVTAAMMVNLAPGLTFLLQFVDGRLRQSAVSLFCIAGITVLVLAGVLARASADRRLATLPLPTEQRDGAAR